MVTRGRAHVSELSAYFLSYFFHQIYEDLEDLTETICIYRIFM